MTPHQVPVPDDAPSDTTPPAGPAPVQPEAVVYLVGVVAGLQVAEFIAAAHRDAPLLVPHDYKDDPSAPQEIRGARETKRGLIELGHTTGQRMIEEQLDETRHVRMRLTVAGTEMAEAIGLDFLAEVQTSYDDLLQRLGHTPEPTRLQNFLNVLERGPSAVVAVEPSGGQTEEGA